MTMCNKIKGILLALVFFLLPTWEVAAQTLYYNRPAEFFEEALVIGNGTMGGIIYGGTEHDRISLNDITLWTGEPCTQNVFSPNTHKTIPTIREALRNSDYREADRLQRDVQGHYSQNYQPLGQLTIDYFDTIETVTDYRRWLDIGDATAHTEYRRGFYRYTTEYFATHPDSGIVIRITTDNPQGLQARFSLSCQLPHSTVATDSHSLVTDGYAAFTSLPHYYDAEEEKFAYDPDRGIHFRTKVFVNARNTRAEGDAIVVEGVQEATLYVVNATSFNGYDRDPVKKGKPYRQLADSCLQRLSGIGYDELRKRHVMDYQQFYNRVTLTLGNLPDERPTEVQLREYVDEHRFNPGLEALYFQYGRYLLISCSRTSGVPANLQGLWNESVLPPWSSNYTCNINLEENYWAAEAAALPEMHLSLLTFLKALQVSGEVTSKAFYGVDRGWCLAHNSDIWAMTCPVGLHSGDPMWANWNMGGAWLSTHIWEHYAFSLDRDFLREYYPVLKGAAEFCLGWLVSTKEMGVEGTEYFITAPSTSPENVFVTSDGYHGSTCYGGFADIAMIRECLADARDAAIVLGLDRDFIAEANAALEQLQPYKIGKKGNLQEWFFDWEDADPHHRHQSHLFGVYPGHHLEDGTNTKEALQSAALRTLELKGDKTTGWSTGWRVNLYARLHDAENAYHCYRKLLSYVSPDGYHGDEARRGGGTYPNLLDAHSPFQIDGNFGGCAGVIEMLLQSDFTLDAKGRPSVTLELLPALPENWKDGAVSGIRARGGITVDMTWKDSRVTTLTLTALHPCKITLWMNGKRKNVKVCSAQTPVVVATKKPSPFRQRLTCSLFTSH